MSLIPLARKKPKRERPNRKYEPIIYPQNRDEAIQREFKMREIRSRQPRDVIYSNRRNINELGLDKEFLNSLESDTKVLELGSGTGRLAKYLLGNSKLKRENYTIFDLSYMDKMPYLKGRIWRSYKSGKLNLLGGNYYTFDFGDEKWHHIIIPHAFFTPFHGLVEEKETPHLIKTLANKFLPHCYDGGSLRINHVDTPERIPEKDLLQFNKFLKTLEKKGITIKWENGSIIFTKPQKMPIFK